jgi:expansin (peptidoglycan-binding protein)
VRLWLASLLLVAGCTCRDDAPPPIDATSCADLGVHAGEATFYDADGSGSCSFAASPDDLLVAAINGEDWDGSAPCGACVLVKGPSGTVVARIVDKCPGCADGDLDLSAEAFARIAEPKRGRVPIRWRFVGCDVGGPVRYRFKDGSNAHWTAFQVRNHRHGIASVEARPASGDWRTIRRESYNYFVTPKGLGDGPIGVRVTDVHGQMIEDEGITPGDATEVAGSAQFPECE